MEVVTPEDRSRFFDDLNILELVILSGLLQEYNVHNHVPSDVAIGMPFLPSTKIKMQNYLNEIASWTIQNKMYINESKSKFIIFSRSKDQFATRLSLNGLGIERVSVIKCLGIWLQEDMGWERNTKEMCTLEKL